MKILNLNNKLMYKDLTNINLSSSESYLILASLDEIEILKEHLVLKEEMINESLSINSNIKLNVYDNYDFFTFNTSSISNDFDNVDKINLYMSDNYIVVVSNEDNFMYKYIEKIVDKDNQIKEIGKIALFKLNYMIFKLIVVNNFEICEKVEDKILEIEDKILEKIKDKHSDQISEIRNITRYIVKNIRPLIYVDDIILNENIRYLKDAEVKNYYLENYRNLDLEVDKLYNFALSNRELADKLLDIYTSKVAENTNSLITKLTILTAIFSPLAIITGIYGMNFKYMPELNYIYGYPITIFIMSMILIIGIIIMKKNKVL